MASFSFWINQLLTLLLSGLATVHAAGQPGTMPPAVGNPGPPALPNSNGVAPSTQDAHWYGIKQWTSLGDSYATGVGVGDSLSWNRCVHFSDAYPLLMNKDERMPGEWGDQRRLWDCTCSGATTQDILDHQFLDKPESDSIYGDRSEFGSPQIATLTAGGDDIEFLWLIMYCVLQFFKNNPCDQQITRSRGILESDKFYNSLDYVVKNALIRGIKAAGPGFKLFVTGYAQFWNEDSDQCDSACFSYWDPKCENSEKLTKDLRQRLNQLAKDLNQKIQDVVKNNEQWAVEYADYDAEFSGHRFCEEGITEPDNNNPNIWFFHLNTEGNGRTQAIDDKYAAMLDENGNKDDFYASIKNRSATGWATGLNGQPDSAAYDLLFKVGDNSDVAIQNALSGYIRIFHPTRPGIDTMTTKIFGQFPNWPKPDPPPAVASGPAQPTSSSTPPTTTPAASPPQSTNLPDPVCKPNVDGAKPFSEDDGNKAINQICGNRDYWDKAYVAPVSVTTGKDNQGRSTALAADESIDIAGGNKLYVQVAFDETDCVGEGAFVIGNTDDEKLAYCTDRFGRILNGCNTNTQSAKLGGLLRDVCMIYKITAVPADAPDPHTLPGTGPLGDFTCKDTDVSAIGGASSIIANTCTCWYANLPNSTATFDEPPQPSKCADVTKVPSKTFEAKVGKRDVETGDLGRLEELVRRHPARRYMGRGVLDEKVRVGMGTGKV